MDPTQVYETTIYNREQRGEAFTFATVPVRSLRDGELPSVDEVARTLALRPIRGEGPRATRITPVEAWSLPFLVDAALGRYPDYPFELAFYFDPLEPRRPRRGPSQFAQYLTYEPVIPFESSPLGAKSLAALVTGATTVGAALGYAATREPIVLLTVPAGLVLGGAAVGAAAGTAIGLAEIVRYRLRKLLGVPDDESSPDEPSEE
jgi:hypothetical protein